MLPVSETDFETQVLEAGVNVFFKPTKSHYTFLRLSNDKHVARSAPLALGQNKHCLSGKGQKGTLQETALYNPSTMNARDFVALIRMAVISFVF